MDPETYWLTKYLLFADAGTASLIGGDEGDKGGGGGGGGGDEDDKGGGGGGGDLVTLEFAQDVFAGVPEQFRKTEGEGDEAKEVIDLATFTKSWKDQQEHIKSKTFNPPADAKDYKFEPSDDEMKANAEKALLVDKELGEDPVIHAFRGVAHEIGLSQDQWQKIIGFFVNEQGPRMDPPIDREEEKSKLGADFPKLSKYLDDVRGNLVANGTFSDGMEKEMLIAGQTAEGMRMLNALLQQGGGTVVLPKLKPENQAARRDELQAKILDLTKRRDSGEITAERANREYAEIQREYQDVVGEQEGGTSVVFND